MKRGIAALIMIAACAAPQKKDDELAKRVAATQDAQASIERRLADLETRLAAMSDQQGQLDDLRLGIVELQADVKRLADDVAAAQAAGAKPPVAVGPPRAPVPDPDKVYSLAIDGDPVRGDKKAKVTIVEGGEFACPFCIKVRETRSQIEKNYGKDVRIVFKNFVVHPQIATQPALAGCAANKQGKFWEFEDALVASAWDLTQGYPKLDRDKLLDDNLVKIADQLGLDMDKFKSDMAGEACKKDLADDQAALTTVGMRGTPTFYINGRYLSGAQPYEAFQKIIDEELDKAKAAVKAGTKAEKYYQKVVVDGGLKKLEP